MTLKKGERKTKQNQIKRRGFRGEGQGAAFITDPACTLRDVLVLQIFFFLIIDRRERYSMPIECCCTVAAIVKRPERIPPEG